MRRSSVFLGLFATVGGMLAACSSNESGETGDDQNVIAAGSEAKVTVPGEACGGDGKDSCPSGFKCAAICREGVPQEHCANTGKPIACGGDGKDNCPSGLKCSAICREGVPQEHCANTC